MNVPPADADHAAALLCLFALFVLAPWLFAALLLVLWRSFRKWW